jgi:poly(A) polymerase
MSLDRTLWDAVLTASDAGLRLEELQEEGTIREVFPDLQKLVGFGGGGTGHKDLWAHTKQVVMQTVPKIPLRWAALFHDVGKPVAFVKTKDKDGEDKITFHDHEAVSARIFKKIARDTGGFTPEEVDEILFVIRNLGHVEAYDSEWTDSAVRRLTKDLGGYLDSVFAVARADCTTARFEKRQRNMGLTHELRTRIDKLKLEDATPPALPKGLGDALQAHLGLTPGVELGEVMKDLRARVASGELPRNAAIEVYLPHARRVNP